MEKQCQWGRVLQIAVLSHDERQVLERFEVSGRSAEVPVPKVGDALSLVEAETQQALKVVRVTFVGHELCRRGAPWRWRSTWEVKARL